MRGALAGRNTIDGLPTMTGKKILVLGATGGTGRQLVSQAVQQGQEVTVLVRRPEQATGFAESLRVLVGDVVEDPDALAEAIYHQEVVISTLGVGRALRSGGLIARSVPLIVQAMERQGVRRLILTSAYGVGATWNHVPVLPRIVMRLLFRDLYTDKKLGEEVLQRSELDW